MIVTTMYGFMLYFGLKARSASANSFRSSIKGANVASKVRAMRSGDVDSKDLNKAARG